MQYLSKKLMEAYISDVAPIINTTINTMYDGRIWYNTTENINYNLEDDGSGGLEWSMSETYTQTQTQTPTLTGVTSADEKNVIDITITNYDSGASYSVSSDKGSITRSNNVITWTLPDVVTNEVGTLSVTAQKAGEGLSNPGVHTVNILDVPVTDDQTLVYNASSMDEFTDLVNAEISSLDSTPVDTIDVMDHNETSTVSVIYLDNKKVTVESGETITTDSESFIVETVDNTGVVTTIDDVNQLAVGQNFAMAIKSDGTVWGTGSNGYGQLGDGTTTTRNVFTQAVAVTNAVFIACGTNHTLIIKSDGTVWGCGYNNYGNLGTNDTSDKHVFTKATSTGSDAVYIANGSTNASLIIKSDGTVWGCGIQNHGELGTGNTTEYHVFTQSTQPQGSNAVKIACGVGFTIILKADGTVHGCGNNSKGQLGTDNTTTYNVFTQATIAGTSGIDVSCGSNYTMIIKSDGTVWGTGYNGYGELGTGNTTEYHVFTQASSAGVNAVMISCGLATHITKTDGTVWGTGRNTDGEIGDGTTTDRTVFTQTTSTGINAVLLSAYHSTGSTLIVKKDGTIWGTGTNTQGQLGTNNTTNSDAFIQSIAPNGENVFPVGSVSWVYSIPYSVTPESVLNSTPTSAYLNTHRGISNAVIQEVTDTDFRGFKSISTKEEIVEIQDDANINQNTIQKVYIDDNKLTEIRSGEKYTSEHGEVFEVNTITTDGSGYWFTPKTTLNKIPSKIYPLVNVKFKIPNEDDQVLSTRGINFNPTVGTTNHIDETKTSTVSKIYIDNKEFDASVGETYATDNNEVFTVKVVGNNGNISVLGNVKKIAVGQFFTVAIRAGGDVWGTDSAPFNTYKESEDGLFVQATSAGSDAIDIACSNSDVLIIKSDGTLWGSGLNNKGQLGLNNTDSKTTFTYISSAGSNVVGIACGHSHSMIIKSDGTVWGCGWNSRGQLGDDTTVDKLVFTKSYNGINCRAIACGTSATMVIKTDGTVWGTGRNYFGQLGNGTSTDNKIFTQATSAGSDAATIACGNYSSLIIKKDGTVWGAGRNDYGSLGTGDNSDKHVFTQVTSAGSDVVAIACGEHHTMIIKSDGTVWGTGYNNKGQIGNDTLTNLNVFVQSIQTEGSDAVAIACHVQATMIIKSDGYIWGTGRNDQGQLGDGTYTDRSRFTVSHQQEGSGFDATPQAFKLYYDEYWVVPSSDLSTVPGNIYTWTPNYITQNFNDKLIPSCREFKTDVHLNDNAKLQEISATIQKNN